MLPSSSSSKIDLFILSLSSKLNLGVGRRLFISFLLLNIVVTLFAWSFSDSAELTSPPQDSSSSSFSSLSYVFVLSLISWKGCSLVFYVGY